MTIVKKLEREQQKLQREIEDKKMRLASVNRKLAWRRTENPIYPRLTKHSILEAMDNIGNTFTTRSLAQAVLGEGVRVTGQHCSFVGTSLRPLVAEGKLRRAPVNAFDSKNNGQLLYFKV